MSSATNPSITLVATRCPTYAPDRVQQALSELLAPLGGLKNFVKPGQTVFLKPNLLSSKNPDESITTHPVIVETLTRMCQELGAKVMIGDSPPLALGTIENYWKETGMKGVADHTGASLFSLEKEPRREITIPGPQGPLRIHVTEWYYKADVVINLPKLKTHNLTVITGAVKNHFGLLPGVQKPQLHRKFPKPLEFGHMMAEVFRAIPMHLTIMDAVWGMDEEGPANGRVIKPGFLLASPNPIAVDFGFCDIMGINPLQLPVFEYLARKKIGPASLQNLTLAGEPLSNLKFPDFHPPPTNFLWMVPNSMVHLAQRLLQARPNIIQKKCTKCGACYRICPAKAIVVEEAGMRIRRSPCIECFCCTEVCPQKTIELETSPLLALALQARKVKLFLQGRKD